MRYVMTEKQKDRIETILMAIILYLILVIAG